MGRIGISPAGISKLLAECRLFYLETLGGSFASLHIETNAAVLFIRTYNIVQLRACGDGCCDYAHPHHGVPFNAPALGFLRCV
jgi:hypothetical protein